MTASAGEPAVNGLAGPGVGERMGVVSGASFRLPLSGSHSIQNDCVKVGEQLAAGVHATVPVNVVEFNHNSCA